MYSFGIILKMFILKMKK